MQAPLAQSAPKGQKHGVLTGCSRWARLHVPEQPGWLQHGELRADGGAHSSARGQLGPHHRRANEGEGHERAPQAEPPPPETSSKCSPWATEPILREEGKEEEGEENEKEEEEEKEEEVSRSLP